MSEEGVAKRLKLGGESAVNPAKGRIDQLPTDIISRLLVPQWPHASHLACMCKAFAAVIRRRSYWRAVAAAELALRFDAEGMYPEPRIREEILAYINPLYSMPIELPLLPRLEWHTFLYFVRRRDWCKVSVAEVSFLSRCGRYCLQFGADACVRFYRTQRIANLEWRPHSIFDEEDDPEFVAIHPHISRRVVPHSNAPVDYRLNPSAPEYVLQPNGLWYVQLDNQILWMRSAGRNARGKRWHGGCIEEGAILKEVKGAGWWA